MPRLEWRNVGQECSVRHVTEGEVVEIHNALVRDFADADDPISPSGVRNQTLLASAVFRQQTSIGNTVKYPTIEMASAALLHALVQNHPFHNGNKRTALVSMLVCLDENGVMLTCDEDALFRLVLLVAQHRLVDRHLPDLADRETLAIAEWVFGHTRWVDRRDRPLPWRRLKQILGSYGCTFASGGSGNRINISRAVKRPYLHFFSRTETLKVQVFYAGDGREAEPNTIAEVRRVLRLDEMNGVDSGTFYDNQPTSPSEFIVKYRKTLRRLAKL